jgi:hypothetical protein
MNYKEQTLALKTLFDGLPNLLESQKAKTGRHAQSFLISCPSSRLDHPRFPVRGTKHGLKELKTLERLLLRLRRHIDSMSADALRVFASHQRLIDLQEIVVEDDDLLDDIRQAHQRLSREEKMIPPPAKGRKKQWAAAITVEAGDIYTELTGKPPGRSISPKDGRHTGHFHSFLKELFKILDIDSSAGSQIDLMIRGVKKNPVLTARIMEKKPTK